MPRKHGFSKCMGAMLANSHDPYTKAFVIMAPDVLVWVLSVLEGIALPWIILEIRSPGFINTSSVVICCCQYVGKFTTFCHCVTHSPGTWYVYIQAEWLGLITQLTSTSSHSLHHVSTVFFHCYTDYKWQYESQISVVNVLLIFCTCIWGSVHARR